jgi:hypothetical protein
MFQWADRLARAIYRRGGDNAKQLPFVLQALLLACPVSLVILVAVFVFPHLHQEFGDFGLGRPSVPFSYRNWHVVYGEPHNQDLVEADCAESPLCLARPDNPILWNSHPRRSDREAHFRKVNSLAEAGAYWIGIRVPAETVNEAKRLGLTQIILGYVSGSFEIYLNGHLFRKSEREPVRRPLILSQLDHFKDVYAEGRDLFIAVKVRNDTRAIFPDALAEPLPSGFATAEQVTFYARSVVFRWQSSPFFLVGTFFSLGFFFFLIAIANRRKMEYCAVSAYAILHGFRESLEMSLIFSKLGEAVTARLTVFLSGMEVAAVILLGLTICRANFKLLFRSTLALIGMAILPLLVFSSPFELLVTGHRVWNVTLLPAAYFVGAFFCFIQWRLIRVDRLEERLEEDRLTRLAIYSGVFLLMGLVHVAHHAFFSQGVGLETGVAYRLANLAFVVVMGGIAVRTYNVQLQFLNKGVTSRYHRRHSLPEYVQGALLELDIKGSEALFRLNYSQGVGAAIMQECVSNLWAVAAKHGAEVIRTEGDALVCLFEGDTSEEAMLRAVEVFSSTEETLDHFFRNLDSRAKAVLPYGRMSFRAALVYGRVKPTWQAVEGTSQPGWQEFGERNIFVDSARLLEIEKEVCGKDGSSLMIQAEDGDILAPQLERCGYSFFIRGQVFLGKHGRPYRVSGILPRSRTPQLQKAG